MEGSPPVERCLACAYDRDRFQDTAAKGTFGGARLPNVIEVLHEGTDGRSTPSSVYTYTFAEPSLWCEQRRARHSQIQI